MMKTQSDSDFDSPRRLTYHQTHMTELPVFIEIDRKHRYKLRISSLVTPFQMTYDSPGTKVV